MDVEPVLKERGEMYNRGRSHHDNFECAFRLRTIFRSYAVHNENLSIVEQHAIEMLLVKVARIATGAHVEENYLDICGYAKLAQLSREERK